MGDVIFSFSRLNLYEQCPYRFYKKYIEGYEEPITQPLALGKAVHKAIEDKINGVTHKESVLNGYMEADFHEEISHKEISDLVGNAPMQSNMGETEVYFKLPLSDEANTPIIQGYIDLYSPNGAITDWKTNRIAYDVMDNKQLALYSWAISQIKGINSVEGILYFLRFRRGSKHIFTVEDMEEAREWALDKANEINKKLVLADILPNEYKKLFPANPSRICKHCPFAWDCIKVNHKSSPHRI